MFGPRAATEKLGNDEASDESTSGQNPKHEAPLGAGFGDEVGRCEEEQQSCETEQEKRLGAAVFRYDGASVNQRVGGEGLPAGVEDPAGKEGDKPAVGVLVVVFPDA